MPKEVGQAIKSNLNCQQIKYCYWNLANKTIAIVANPGRGVGLYRGGGREDHAAWKIDFIAANIH